MQNSLRQYNSQGFRIDKTLFFSLYLKPIRSVFFFNQTVLFNYMAEDYAFKNKQNMLFLKLCFTYNSASYVINYILIILEKNG